MFRYTKLSILAVAMMGAGIAAHAAKPEVDDALAIGKAKISLSQAITAAEQHAKGKAARAEFEPSKKGGYTYDVEVVSGAKVFDVKVDADKGTVISSNEDKADHDDEHDEKD